MDENKEKDEALFLDTKKPLFLENEQALCLETGSRHNAGGQTRTRQTESYYGSVVKRLISGCTGEQPDLPPEAVQMRAMKDATISLIAKKRKGKTAKRTWRVYQAALTYGIEKNLKALKDQILQRPLREGVRQILGRALGLNLRGNSLKTFMIEKDLKMWRTGHSSGNFQGMRT